MELRILKTLKYRITFPSPYSFLKRYLLVGLAETRLIHLSCFILEGTLLSCNLLRFLPSELAAGSVYLARCVTSSSPFCAAIANVSGYTEKKVAYAARAILQERAALPPVCFRSINRKYMTDQFSGVAATRFPNSI